MDKAARAHERDAARPRRARHGWGRRLPPDHHAVAVTRSASSASAWAGCSRSSSPRCRATRSAPRFRTTAPRIGEDAARLVRPHRPGARPLRRGRRLLPSDATMALGRQLEEMGKDVTFILYPDMGHAFCNEEDPLGNFDEPNNQEAWAWTVDFLHEHSDETAAGRASHRNAVTGVYAERLTAPVRTTTGTAQEPMVPTFRCRQGAAGVAVQDGVDLGIDGIDDGVEIGRGRLRRRVPRAPGRPGPDDRGPVLPARPEAAAAPPLRPGVRAPAGGLGPSPTW